MNKTSNSISNANSNGNGKNKLYLVQVISDTDSGIREIDESKTKVFTDIEKARAYKQELSEGLREEWLEESFDGDEEWMEDCVDDEVKGNGTECFTIFNQDEDESVDVLLQTVTISD